MKKFGILALLLLTSCSGLKVIAQKDRQEIQKIGHDSFDEALDSSIAATDDGVKVWRR